MSMKMAPQCVSEVESIIYHFLAFGFDYPNAANLEKLRNVWPIVQEAAADLGKDRATPCPDPAALDEALDEVQALRLDDVQVEYTRLFITGFPRTPARAVESVYREGVLIGEAAEQVAECYRQYGLESHDEFVDSMASEAEFLAYLSGQETDDPEELAGLAAAQRAFLKRHFLKWAPQFARDVKRHAELKLYQSLAAYVAWICKVETVRHPEDRSPREATH